jgi:hypothetical protein
MLEILRAECEKQNERVERFTARRAAVAA